jgi:hypothetical protein
MVNNNTKDFMMDATPMAFDTEDLAGPGAV